MTDENTGEWIQCVVDSDYEIYSDYPYPIKRLGSDRIIKECLSKGYLRCSLNGKMYSKHRIIAQQFIPNPNNLPQVDHVNHNKTDNRLENLRWVNASQNNYNRSSYNRIQVQYVDSLPDDVIPITFYRGNEFENLYYSKTNDKVYYDNGANYRVLNYNIASNLRYVRCKDVNLHSRAIYIDVWLREEGW